MYRNYTAAQQVSAMYYDMMLETEGCKATAFRHAETLAAALKGGKDESGNWTFPDGSAAELTAGGCWISERPN